MTTISVKNLEKKYRNAKENALKGVSLSVLKGEIYGLLGPNGSGKTTTISIMSGILKPTRGDVRICEKDIRREAKNVKKLIGLVPQEVALYPTLTLKENLTYFGTMQGLQGGLLHERISLCLKIAQLEKFTNQPIATFSGGMKRRANLVTGIIHKPPVLFLDEPTVGVDPQSRNVIFDALNELKNEGMTMIYTTHYMEEAQQMCSRLGIMDAGSIISEGTPQELIDSVPGCSNLGEAFLSLTGKQIRD